MILVAMEVLLLCLRMLYFCMAYEHFGALLRMVLIVIKVSGGVLAICTCQLLASSMHATFLCLT